MRKSTNLNYSPLEARQGSLNSLSGAKRGQYLMILSYKDRREPHIPKAGSSNRYVLEARVQKTDGDVRAATRQRSLTRLKKAIVC